MGSSWKSALKRGKWLPTLRPNKLTWTMSPSLGCQHLNSPSPFYYYLFGKYTQIHMNKYTFIIPEIVEGWVDLCTANGVQPKAVYHNGFSDRHTNFPQWDLILMCYCQALDHGSVQWCVIRALLSNLVYHPTGVGKWVPASAGKEKAGMVHSVSGWTRGVQVKLWDPLRTRAIPERLRAGFTNES